METDTLTEVVMTGKNFLKAAGWALRESPLGASWFFEVKPGFEIIVKCNGERIKISGFLNKTAPSNRSSVQYYENGEMIENERKYIPIEEIQDVSVTTQKRKRLK